MSKRIKVSASIAFVLCTIYMILYNTNVLIYFTEFSTVSVESFEFKTHVLYTKGCKVPRFDPFDPVVVEYYKPMRGDINCTGKKYFMLKNNIVIVDEAQVKTDFPDDFEDFNCTYEPIYRNPNNDSSNADGKFGYGNLDILHFSESLPSEFAKVTCRISEKIVHEEFLASTPIKPSLENRCSRDSAIKIRMSDPLNIIMIGIDSVSKLNFERHFRLTSEYLRQNLSAFEFHGYMKVADNTFPNLVPVLTGHFIKHYYNKTTKGRYFDDLDFIWKNFSSIGYRILYAEDAPDMNTFNYLKKGFQFPPTDYYFRPFTLAIEDKPWHKASDDDCLGANPEIIVLFNYLRNFLSTMQNRPHFSFTWAARLTHGNVNKAGLGDKPSFELLKDIHEMGLLKKSVLIFMSDHGIRFGGIRKTFIGKIEERMPFLFISFPAWFLESKPELRANLFSNQYKLTTPFDLHETLVDLYQMMSGDESYVGTPYGISLFRDISPDRNCRTAFILPHWCVCHEYKMLNINDEMATAGGEALVEAVNNITMEHRNLCEKLTLSEILDARVSKPEEELLKFDELESGDDESSAIYGKNSDSFEKLMITVRTEPGGAEFEATIRKIKNYYKTYDISRINKYGKQGDCVEDSNLRKYCYCNTNI